MVLYSVCCEKLCIANKFYMTKRSQEIKVMNIYQACIIFQMDSYSLFENIYPSADNQVSGIVALLAAAEALRKYKDHFDNTTKDILFTFLNGVSI